MATAILSLCTGSQNRDEPHVLQKPRRTRSLDWYQAKASSLSNC